MRPIRYTERERIIIEIKDQRIAELERKIADLELMLALTERHANRWSLIRYGATTDGTKLMHT